jgi:poly [ADP-ribose] polymerase 6/8
LHDYIIYRLPTICNYCVHCDEIPDYVKKRGNVMLKPFICRSALCNFQYLTMNLGVGIGALASSLNLSYLLTFATLMAIKSKRMDDVLNPYPTIMNPDGTFLLSEDNKNTELLKEIASAFPLERTDDFIHRIMECHPYAHALYKNIEDSNRSYIGEILGEKIPDVGTDEQYVVLMDSPERDADFKQRKLVHGSVFAFHGSPIENWHGILRSGLKNATGTKLMISGNAFGPGIYVSPKITYSCHYSLRGADYNILSIVELIDRDIKRHNGDVWTLLDSGDVAIRFLLVYKKDAKYTSKLCLDTKTEGVNEMLHNILRNA